MKEKKKKNCIDQLVLGRKQKSILSIHENAYIKRVN